MTCKFDIYQNGNCYHAKHTPYGGTCNSQDCKLKHDKYPPKNKAYDDMSTGGWLGENWIDKGINPWTGEVTNGKDM